MFGLTFLGDCIVFVGGIVIGVMFKDKLIWIKNKLVAIYNWIKAKVGK